MEGDGIVSFGVTPSPTVSRRNVKASPKIVSETPSLPSMCTAGGVNSTSPCSFRNRTFSSPGAWLTPSSWYRKSMCQDARRNSPSVADCSPASRCMRTASRIAASSTARSSSAGSAPAPNASRARSRAGGRSRLPTWSARNGGRVRGAIARHGSRPARLTYCAASGRRGPGDDERSDEAPVSLWGRRGLLSFSGPASGRWSGATVGSGDRGEHAVGRRGGRARDVHAGGLRLAGGGHDAHEERGPRGRQERAHVRTVLARLLGGRVRAGVRGRERGGRDGRVLARPRGAARDRAGAVRRLLRRPGRGGLPVRGRVRGRLGRHRLCRRGR